MTANRLPGGGSVLASEPQVSATIHFTFVQQRFSPHLSSTQIRIYPPKSTGNFSPFVQQDFDGQNGIRTHMPQDLTALAVSRLVKQRKVGRHRVAPSVFAGAPVRLGIMAISLHVRQSP